MSVIKFFEWVASRYAQRETQNQLFLSKLTATFSNTLLYLDFSKLHDPDEHGFIFRIAESTVCDFLSAERLEPSSERKAAELYTLWKAGATA